MSDTNLSSSSVDELSYAEDEPLDWHGSKIEAAVKGASISRVVSALMRHAVESKASDIHIEPNGKETRVRYRVDGMLRTLLTLPGYLHSALVARIKALARLKHGELRLPQDGRITLVVNGKRNDFRVSTLPVVDDEKVVMRALDVSTGAPTLEGLGFRREHREILRSEIMKPHGMILLAGPAGSGKSTTLAALLGMLEGERGDISTLEDSVEYLLPGVRHSQIRPEAGFTFASGLRAIARQDPDVIMVGDLRDQETCELAAHAALTGHLILAAARAGDAVGVIPRLTGLGVEPFLLSSALNFMASQRVVRKICEHCREDDEVPEGIIRMAREILRGIPAKYLPSAPPLEGSLPFKKGGGCVRCSDTGYDGGTVIAELVSLTPEMRKLMNAGSSVDEIKAEVRAQGGITLREDAVLKALEGLTTIDEALRLTRE